MKVEKPSRQRKVLFVFTAVPSCIRKRRSVGLRGPLGSGVCILKASIGLLIRTDLEHSSSVLVPAISSRSTLFHKQSDSLIECGF